MGSSASYIVYPFTLRVRYTLSDESNGYKLSDDSSTPFYSTSNGFFTLRVTGITGMPNPNI